MDDQTHERADLALILSGQFPKTGAPALLQRRNGESFPALLFVGSLRCAELLDGESDGWLVNVVDVSSQAAAPSASIGCPRLAPDELIAELTQARAAAVAADEMKRNFLSRVNHELRTPLNSIAGLTYLLRQSPLTPLQCNRVEKIDRASRQLLTLMTEILEFARVQSEPRTPPDKLVDAPAIVADVANAIAQKARDKGLFVALALADVQPDLLGNPLSLRQALLNYADNAVKYTESGGITLCASTETDSAAATVLRFEVRDTGEGIAPEVLPRLFAAFEQGDNSNTRRHGGLGLGLAMTRSLARSMGGDAGVTSRPGGGSTFWFTAHFRKAEATPALLATRTHLPPVPPRNEYAGAGAGRGPTHPPFHL